MNTSEHILFWSTFEPTVDTNLDSWTNRQIRVSPFHKLALASHVKLGHKTVIYTYQQFEPGQIPPEIEIRPAHPIFAAFRAHRALRAGHSIAHISDAIRLKRAAKCNGIVIDMDAVLLRDLPDDEGWCASMPAKQTGGFAPKWGSSHPPIVVHDQSWDGRALGAFPFKVSVTSAAYAQALSHKIMRTLMAQPKTDSDAWNYVIWTMKQVVAKDKTTKAYPPNAFCPMPAWLKSGKCFSIESPTRLTGEIELFGYTLPSIDEIIANSFTVQHFMESSFQKSGVVDDTFWAKVPAKCLVAREAEHVLGPDWRKQLTS